MLRSAYVKRDRLVTDVGGPSRTRQEFKDECDINVLMKRYATSGMMPSATRPPMYLDLTMVPNNLHEALQVVERSKAAFMSIPAAARAAMDNDPVKFVNFASDPANLDQMREWGLAPPLPAEPSAAPAAAPAQAPSSGA